MKPFLFLLAVAAAAIITVTAVAVFPGITIAQGPLIPPGAPAPTMKTLDQVEARTALPRASDYSGANVTYPIVLSASGSYYLTANLAVATGDVIQITAPNVTLDLNGFTISTTAASPSGTAVSIKNSRVTVCNGFIYGSGIGSNTGPYSGGGFQHGVHIFDDTVVSVTARDLTVSGCANRGIYIFANVTNSTLRRPTSLAERCVVSNTEAPASTPASCALAHQTSAAASRRFGARKFRILPAQAPARELSGTT